MNKLRAAPLLAALVAVAVAWPATRNGWVQFDEEMYARSSYLLLLSLWPSNVARLMTSAGPGYQHQPITYLSHAVDHALWGEAATGFHAADVALYALLTLLVARFAGAVASDLPRLRRRAAMVSFSAGALFAVHPVHVENYAWIADRKDLLAALFTMAALLFERRARRGGRARGWLRMAAMSAFVLGMGAKVAGMGLGLLVALDTWLEPPRVAPLRERVRRAVMAGLPYLLVGALLSAAWLAAQRGYPVKLSGGDAVTGLDGSPAERALFPLRCLGRYVRILGLPAQQAVLYRAEPGLLAWALDLGALLVSAAGSGLLWWRVAALRAPLLLGWAWFLIGLGPTLNIVPLGFVNDRYLLLPSVGVAFAAAGAFALALEGREARGALRRRAVLAFGAAALLVLAGLSGRRIPDWADARSLWGSLVRFDPLDSRGHLCLAADRLRHGEPDAAEVHLEAARALAPDPALSAFVSAHLHMARGDTGALDEHLESTLAAGVEDLGVTALMLARRALGRQDLARARALAEDVLRVYPRHADMQAVLGKVLLAEGRPAAALPLLAFAAHHVADPDSTYHAALAAERAGDLGQAGLHLEVLERAGPTWSSRLMAARIAAASGRQDEALLALHAARRLLPAGGDQGRDAVGVALAQAGALGEAVAVLSELHARGGASAAAIYDLARIEALLGRMADARRHLAEATARDPALAERAATDPALREVNERFQSSD